MIAIAENTQKRKHFMELSKEERDHYREEETKLQRRVNEIRSTLITSHKHFRRGLQAIIFERFFNHAQNVLYEMSKFDAWRIHGAEEEGSYFGHWKKMYEALLGTEKDVFTEQAMREFLKVYFHEKKNLKKLDDRDHGKHLLPFLTPGTIVKFKKHIKNKDQSYAIVKSVRFTHSHFSQILIEDPEVHQMGSPGGRQWELVSDTFDIGHIERIEKYKPGPMKFDIIDVESSLDGRLWVCQDEARDFVLSAMSLDEVTKGRISFTKVIDVIRMRHITKHGPNGLKMTTALKKHIRRNQNRCLFTLKELRKMAEQQNKQMAEELDY